MGVSKRLAWREGVAVADDGHGGLCIQAPHGRIVLPGVSPAMRVTLGRLESPGADDERLADEVLAAGGTDALARWYYHLRTLSQRGLVARAVMLDDNRLATLVPLGADPEPERLVSTTDDRPHVLSRFSHLRRQGRTLVLESPLARARVVLDDERAAALVAALAEPATAAELAARLPLLPADAVGALFALVVRAGLIEPSVDDEAGRGSIAELWEFHDLLFHARSRRGRSDAAFGATYRLAGRVEPPPALKPARAPDALSLDQPDLESFARSDPPFAEVLESRRSYRAYGERPITARQLGEFLYRVARVTDLREAEVETPAGPVRMAFVSRPYPSGGGLHELEFYVAVQTCEGIAPDLYRYEPQQHRLEPRQAEPSLLNLLVREGAASAGLAPDAIQVLVILAARFPRLTWKYSSIAYALCLKHVGVVFQSMYLVATAMRLAPCALGSGDSDLFARAAGTDYYAETSVGEFLLGSRPG